MERLTNKKEADAQRRRYEKRLENGYPRNIPEERFLKLAAYEDTGLEPEEIDSVFVQNVIEENKRFKDLAHAEKDGRLVTHLPGEKVYDRFGTPWIIESSEIHLIQGKLKQLFRCGHPGTEDYYAMYDDEILTREEAAAALKKREE